MSAPYELSTTNTVSGAEARLRALLVRGMAGDAGAYREFLRELAGHLRAFLRRRLARRPDDVEDLVQETLLAVHNQRHTYASDQPLTAWVHAIAKYKLIDHLRRHAGREALNDPLEDEAAIFAASDAEAHDARRDLQRLLERLPQKYRAAIVCTKLEGLSAAETAAQTGMSVSLVKVNVHRGMKALAKLIRGSHEN
jgi:RNA polymerase sigma-70 factor (ECF subfamily)